MKKPYVKPDIALVCVTTATYIMACSICGHPGNHYGHHKPHELENKEDNEL